MAAITETITRKILLFARPDGQFGQSNVIVVEEETVSRSTVLPPGAIGHAALPAITSSGSPSQPLLQKTPHSEANSEPESKSCKACCSNFFAFLVVIAIPVSMMYFGIRDWSACPLQPMIPVFMAVSGATFILLLFLTLCSENKVISICNGVVAAFFLAWQITGSVYVFKEYSDWKEHNGCPNVTYEFSFGILIVFWSMFIVTCCCLCIFKQPDQTS